MTKRMIFKAVLCALALSLLPLRPASAQNLLKGGDEFTALQNGAPAGWKLYGKKENGTLRIENGALLVEDSSATGEIGIVQTVPAEAGKTYGVRAIVREVAPGSMAGAYLQLRFLPSDQYKHISLSAGEADEWKSGDWSSFVVSAVAPEGTSAAQVYLYSHSEPTPKWQVRKVELLPNLKPQNEFPEPVPPQYSRLKALHLETSLAQNGKAAARIAIPENPRYRAAAEKLQQAIKARSGVEIPIARDTQIKVPLEENVILLGNRSTNVALRALYDRFFALTDLKYPGTGGYEVRSVHNPFGNGFNAIILGGSDDAGVAAAVGVLPARLRAANGNASVGRLMEIKLGKGIAPPEKLEDFKIWEASKNYDSTGYFGWNSISKRLAMYYMTGDETQAREALRLAFPDEETKKEITRVDGERIENKDDPLAGPYHYNATHMILFWDLVEESPVFSDAERLKVINAFARQLKHRVANDNNVYGLRGQAQFIGDRHGMYSALSLMALARYFHRDDPDSPVWNQALRASHFYFAPLAEPFPWVAGENDNLYWYSTSIAPVLTYMLLSGDHRAAQNGGLARLLRIQELLWNGRRDDPNLAYTALDYLNKAADLTRDGRWITYRERTGLDTNVFRLGQSFWPDPDIKPAEPLDLVSRWTIGELPPAYAARRDTGFPPAQSFTNASFRSAPDETGDFLLLDGLNGSGRNPYHTFAMLELRLGGNIVLQGYNNQLQTKADGRVEPVVAMDAARLNSDVLGQTATFTAAVPRSPFANWTRTIAQRIGRYAVVLDELQFRENSENFQAQFSWQKTGTRWHALENNAGVGQGSGAMKWTGTVPALDADVAHSAAVSNLGNLGIVLLRAEGAGAWLKMPFELEADWRGALQAQLLDYEDRGKVKFFLDGRDLGISHDSYAPAVRAAAVELGTHDLKAGRHVLRVEVTGKNAQASQFYVGLAGLSAPGARISSAGAASPVPITQIVSADAMEARIQGGIARQVWEGQSQNGARKKFFSLVGQGSAAQPLQAHRLSENAAALRVPQPALAVSGEYQNARGELVLLDGEHAFGHNAHSVGVGSTLLRASQPIDFDWDFKSGIISLASAQATEVFLAVAPGAKITNAGKPLASTPAAGGLSVHLPAGRTVLENAAPAPQTLAELKAQLAQLSVENSLAAVPRAGGGSTPAAPPLQTVFEFQAGGAVSAVEVVREGDKTRLFVASQNSIVELDAAGKTVRTMQTDGPIRVLHWWPQHKLLIAGGTDEKVTAFDENGNRKWTFVSEMAPELVRAGKPYWFKSAPGHGGIHGLGSGVFLDGKSQLFVGSASTLEILDENGKLVKRLPQFWGTVAFFQIVPGPDNSLNLLAGRSITENANLAVINNKTLDPSPRSFRDVPPGVTPVNGWGGQGRFHIFHVDVDGDGKKEIVSEVTGIWNRVTVWDEAGNPKYNVQFGPGESVSGSNRNALIRGIDVADVDGDGQPEIVVALAEKLIIALDGKCEIKWSRKLQDVPSALKIVSGKIAVGCENGDALLLDGKGQTLRQTNVGGRVDELQALGSTQFVAVAGGALRAFDAN